VKAFVLTGEAAVQGAQGNKHRMIELSRKSLSMLPLASPRYAAHLVNLGFHLALRGQESEVDDRLRPYEDDRELRGLILRSRFIQCMETGRFSEARAMLPNLGGRGESVGRLYKPLLDLLEGDESVEPGREDSQALPVMRLLHRRQPRSALQNARVYASTDADSPISGGLIDAYDLLRAELSCGHGDAARRLMRLRHERGNAHYIDDLFLARIELSSGDRERAGRHFAALLRAAERFRAWGRVEFELRLACELNPLELLRWGKTTGTPSNPARPTSDAGVQRLVGDSPAVAEIRRAILRYAPLEAAVLITGETGTGKEVVARALHEESPRKKLPWVAINCGALTESLLESELFGHARGAFTGADRDRAGLFEQAEGGTLFLDEIGEMSPRLQSALLRILENGEYRPVGGAASRICRCRVVAATNSELDRAVAEGRFRNDLLFRLRRLEIQIPPLRRRPEDILILADYFLNSDRPMGARAELSTELKELLLQHPWKGNVRELRHEIERMRLLNSDQRSYTVEHASEGIRNPSDPEDDSQLAVLKGSRSPWRRIDRLRELFRKYRRLTRKEVSKLLKVSKETATRDLRSLVREGFVQRIEPTRSSRSDYFRLQE
jgi:DNA-binding NtrC family response regulator